MMNDKDLSQGAARLDREHWSETNEEFLNQLKSIVLPGPLDVEPSVRRTMARYCLEVLPRDPQITELLQAARPAALVYGLFTLAFMRGVRFGRTSPIKVFTDEA